jgi:protein TonB
MKPLIFLSIAIFFFFYNSSAQVAVRVDSLKLSAIKDTLPPPPQPPYPQVEAPPTDDEQIFIRVEQEAEFPGGVEGWKDYLQKHLRADVPVKNGAPVGQYEVVVLFIVAKDGSISDVRATTNMGYGMEDEVVRIIKKGPKWIPGYQNGRKVNSYRRQPVIFVVENQ